MQPHRPARVVEPDRRRCRLVALWPPATPHDVNV
jgi:hypothetical protein